MASYKNSFNAKNPLNKTLAAAGIEERVVQGSGYVYFVEGAAHTWYSCSIPVCWMRDIDDIIAEWKYLSHKALTPAEEAANAR